MAEVGKWVIEGHSTRIRQAAAQVIVDPEQLRELIRLTRGKDKSVHRILVARRDAQLAEVRGAERHLAEIDAAATAIARHVERPCDAAYAGTLARLEARWQAVAADAGADLQREVSQHLERARLAMEQHRRALEQDKEQRRAAALATEEARHARELAAQAEASAAAEAERAAEEARAAHQAKLEADAAAVRDLTGLLRQAQAALDRGGTARASRLRETIEEKRPHAPAMPPWFDRKLQELDGRINELRDWKTFTVEPKRAELVQRMQSLVGADMSAEELARQIRRLRDEWRTLHRGAGEEPAPVREQFDDAAERAYEPCREHFARQAEQRRENQAKREALLARLAAFAAEQSGDSPDWRLLQQTLFEARREWRQYAPVDQSAIKSLQDRLHAVTDELQRRLDAEYARNVEAKQKLITRASELGAIEPTRQAIEEAKNLQREWRNVGLVPRHQDRALWEEFRKHCDTVFDRSSQESAAHGAALEANQARAIELCEALERIAGLDGDALVADAHPLDQLLAEFESLELPRAKERELRGRFARACDGCREAMRRHDAELARCGWVELFAAADQVRAYALAVVQRHPPEACQTLRASAESAVAGLEHAPPGTRTALEKQLGAVDGGASGGDLAANEKALRLLCVRAEIDAGRPTPPEDVELRREYQMQRLVESMGRGARPTATAFDELAHEWIATGPVEADVYAALRARFEQCREAARPS